jgi:hypothetical protein
MGKVIDLTGKRFGMFVVIKRVENNKWGQTKWNCLCDCGNIKSVQSSALIHGKSLSCGCRGYVIGESNFNRLFDGYRRKAKISFELTKEEFRKLVKGNCFYCGKSPSQIKKDKQLRGEFVYNGIDRIDSSKGYTLNNCVSCCGTCNKAKLLMSQTEFYSWIERVYNHMIKTGE